MTRFILAALLLTLVACEKDLPAQPEAAQPADAKKDSGW